MDWGALVTAVLPTVFSLGVDLIKKAQADFGHDNGTGDVKKSAVSDSLGPYIAALITAGKIVLPAGTTVSKSEVGAIVETIVQQMKVLGLLPSEYNPTPLPTLPAVTQPVSGSVIGQTSAVSVSTGKTYIVQIIGEAK